MAQTVLGSRDLRGQPLSVPTVQFVRSSLGTRTFSYLLGMCSNMWYPSPSPGLLCHCDPLCPNFSHSQESNSLIQHPPFYHILPCVYWWIGGYWWDCNPISLGQSGGRLSPLTGGHPLRHADAVALGYHWPWGAEVSIVPQVSAMLQDWLLGE